MASLVVRDLVVARPNSDRGAPPILDRINLRLAPGAAAAIAGPSGAGKTTLLHAIAGLLKPSSGFIEWDGVEISRWSEGRRDMWRRAKLGMIFQDFQLLPELSAADNIALPYAFDQWRQPTDLNPRMRALAERVGLRDLSTRAGAMSRGEQQRVALARALMREPELLLADEPTASLDRASADAAAALLFDIARERRATLLIISHDRMLLDRFAVIHRLEAGRFQTVAGAP